MRNILLPTLGLVLAACGSSGPASSRPTDAIPGTDVADTHLGATDTGSKFTLPAIEAGAEVAVDVPATDTGVLTLDTSCAVATSDAQVSSQPVDIIWMVDNSASMQPAVAAINSGLTNFASIIEASGLDYHVVMLALRAPDPTVTSGTIGGSIRYPICIPQPLAGDATCGDGPNFLQSMVDIKSTQPLEQFLGVLGQTTGYTAADAPTLTTGTNTWSTHGAGRGGVPFAQFLRATATKTIVVVTDDDPVDGGANRLTNCTAGVAPTFDTTTNTWVGDCPDNFETKPAGALGSIGDMPDGILLPSWNGMFTGYTFNGVYGWGDATNPNLKCSYQSGATPPSSGPTYTALVTETGGVRAQICSDSSAWTTFFNDLATGVVAASKIQCQMPLPTPANGTLNPSKVNVSLTFGATASTIGKAQDAAHCDAGGWY
jgi:hypothetical protein